MPVKTERITALGTLTTDKVDRGGSLLSEISKEIRGHDRRLVRLETLAEVCGMAPSKEGNILTPEAGESN